MSSRRGRFERGSAIASSSPKRRSSPATTTIERNALGEGRGEIRVLSQDRLLELPQDRGRLDPQLSDEVRRSSGRHRVRPPVGRLHRAPASTRRRGARGADARGPAPAAPGRAGRATELQVGLDASSSAARRAASRRWISARENASSARSASGSPRQRSSASVRRRLAWAASAPSASATSRSKRRKST